MKNNVLLLFLILSAIGYTQNGINYKALIKDNLGNLIANSSVDIKFKILESDALTNVYEETHMSTTNNNGILIVNIGKGTIVSGIFNDINWREDDHYLNVKIDTGSGFVDIGTTQFSAVPYAFHAKKAANVKGLEAIDEGNGIGWRLVGRNPSIYGEIGEDAVDLSFSNSIGNPAHGATGRYSFASGWSTTASGDFSIAMGQISIASGDYAVTMGYNTEASGEVSTALGGTTIASGNGSTAMGSATTATEFACTAMGRQTIASGFISTAIGSNTIASGNYSTAVGLYTLAPSYGETTIGSFPTEYDPLGPTNFIDSDRLFTIGNGVSTFSRSNALTILKNGNIGIGNEIPQELLHISGGRLRIGNETLEDGGSDILAFSSSLVPTVDGTDRLGGPNRKWLDVYAVNGTIQTSDRREKKNIKSLSYGLVEVLKMQPVSFNWKNKNNPDTKLGLIAQDLQALVPEVVHTHIWEKDETSGALTKKELERLGVYYSDLVPVLINAIKEQQELLSNQELKIARLTTKVEDLKDLNARIKHIETVLKTSNQFNN